jgi:hypothetical protein
MLSSFEIILPKNGIRTTLTKQLLSSRQLLNFAIFATGISAANCKFWKLMAAIMRTG